MTERHKLGPIPEKVNAAPNRATKENGRWCGGNPRRERADATKAGEARYFTGRPCINGHVAQRYTYSGKCTICIAEKRHERWRESDALRERVRLGAQKYKLRNRDRLLKANADYRKRRRESGAPYTAEARSNHAEWGREYRKRNLLERLRQTIASSINGRLRYHLNNTDAKQTRPVDCLGCSLAEFKAHLERMFSKGMTWDNWGTVWQIDHIIPIVQALTADDVIALNHFTNLRPLAKLKNQQKNKRRELLL